MYTLDDFLDLAIRIEENGERVYRNAESTAPTSETRRLFAWLAEQEVSHADRFREMKARNTAPVEDSQVVQMGRQLLRSVLGEQSFSLHEADLHRMDQATDLLRLSIEFERDTRLFYELLEPFVEAPADKTGLRAIIDEESEHIEHLQTTLARLRDQS